MAHQNSIKLALAASLMLMICVTGKKNSSEAVCVVCVLRRGLSRRTLNAIMPLSTYY
jgi:hypothetical protein